jgi:hypothetical protein
MKVFEAKRGKEDTFVKYLFHWSRVPGSSAAAGAP